MDFNPAFLYSCGACMNFSLSCHILSFLTPPPYCLKHMHGTTMQLACQPCSLHARWPSTWLCHWWCLHTLRSSLLPCIPAALFNWGMYWGHSSFFILGFGVHSLKENWPSPVKPPHSGTLVPNCTPYYLYQYYIGENLFGFAFNLSLSLNPNPNHFCCNNEYLLKVCNVGSIFSVLFIHMCRMD